jgi:cryptochrome
LRLHDNPALLKSIEGCTHLYPIFILDPWFLKPDKVGTNRMQFLLESLTDLNASLTARGSSLIVLQGKPSDIFPKIFKDWSINRLCFEYDTEPYAKERDAEVLQLASAHGIETHTPVSHTLYDLNMLVAKSPGGKAPLTMKGFEKLIDSVGNPLPPAPDPPSKLPPPAPGAKYCGDGNKQSRVPSLVDIGYPPDQATTPFKGGESVALARLADSLSDKDWVAKFEKPKGNPAHFVKPATTVLSPYLKFGCLSPRLFHSQLVAIYAEKKGKHTVPPVSLRGQLLWREFSYLCGASIKNFDRMEGNIVCRQIPWKRNNIELLTAWEEGRTGYPWIDAIMTQLKKQGWMHHLARHSVACFLTRGDLWCSWEEGRDVFDKLLLDADWAINSFNWQWLSASAFFSQYFRVYSPIAFGKQYDPKGTYIRHFLPVLKDMPDKYIYEPWTAPRSVQEAARCIIGKDYPLPIVDHSVVSKENTGKMKIAYAAGKEGDDKVVVIVGGPSSKKPRIGDE